MNRKNVLRVAALLLVLPMLLIGCGLLPAQYQKSYLGALRLKLRLLDAPGEKPRIIVVGGSAAAFGVDGALMAEQLPDYDVIHFGLYAGLGMPMMMELAKGALRPGDVVLVMPEMQRQSLSDFFGAEAAWQAADGDPLWLLRLDRRHWPALAAAFPAFAMAKLRYVLSGVRPESDEIYRLSSFDAAGDLRNDVIDANRMPGGWDLNMPVSLTEHDVPDEAWLKVMTGLAEAAEKQEANVFFAYCPINASALTANSDADACYDALCGLLPCPILGDPNDSILDPGWFFDTNFHLNASGRTVFTTRLIRAIKAELSDSTPTRIDQPMMPKMTSLAVQSGDNSDAMFFTWTERGGQAVLTGVTDEGRRKECLMMPVSVEEMPVGMIADGIFDGCDQLRQVLVQWPSPNQCAVGQGLMAGAPEGLRLAVPKGCTEAYKLNYFWSAYAGRIEEQE